MLVIGVAGTELTAQERDWLQHDAVSGVILFKRNFASREQIAALSAAIRAAAPRPQLLCVDQEGGRVQRFRSAPYPGDCLQRVELVDLVDLAVDDVHLPMRLRGELGVVSDHEDGGARAIDLQ